MTIIKNSMNNIFNIYDILPKEIWITIILKVPCKYISKLYVVNHQFEKFCNEENIIERRKLQGFPREIGHCKSYDVYNYKGSLREIMKNVRSNANIVKLVLNDALNRLYEDNTELIRGDLIDFEIGNNDVFLFDGEKIIDIYIIVPNVYVFPDDLDITNNNVSIEYWKNTKLGNFKFYFNNALVKEQLMNNIIYSDKFGTINHTGFILNNKIYAITFMKKLSLLEIIEKIKDEKMCLFVDSPTNNAIFYCK